MGLFTLFDSEKRHYAQAEKQCKKVLALEDTYAHMSDANIINSPYYYLQQNDVVYVEPNHVKAKNSGLGASTTVWFSFIGIATSVASLLVSVLRD